MAVSASVQPFDWGLDGTPHPPRYYLGILVDGPPDKVVWDCGHHKRHHTGAEALTCASTELGRRARAKK